MGAFLLIGFGAAIRLPGWRHAPALSGATHTIMHPLRRLFAVAVLTLVTVACSGTPTSPSDPSTGGRSTGASLIGTWDGTVSNHPGSYGYGPVRSFVLRLNNEPSASGYIGQWSDNLGCTSSAVIGSVTRTTTGISVESLRCTDGDFYLTWTSASATVVSGTCRGSGCTFRMVRR